MKDVYDVWLLARQFAFDGAVLAKVFAVTFATASPHRHRELSVPVFVAGTKNARSQM